MQKTLKIPQIKDKQNRKGYYSSTNSAKLHGTKSAYRNELYFYTQTHHKLPKSIQREITKVASYLFGKLNLQLREKKQTNLLFKKTPSLDGIAGDLFQIFKEEIKPMLPKPTKSN